MDLRRAFLLVIIILLVYTYISRQQAKPVEITGSIPQREESYPLHSEEKPLSPLDFIKKGILRPKPKPTPSNGS